MHVVFQLCMLSALVAARLSLGGLDGSGADCCRGIHARVLCDGVGDMQVDCIAICMLLYVSMRKEVCVCVSFRACPIRFASILGYITLSRDRGM